MAFVANNVHGDTPCLCMFPSYVLKVDFYIVCVLRAIHVGISLSAKVQVHIFVCLVLCMCMLPFINVVSFMLVWYHALIHTCLHTCSAVLK